MTNRSSERLIVRVLHRLAATNAVFHCVHVPLYWGTLSRLGAALDAQPGERILDVGCGTGVGLALARGFYVGIDVDLVRLRFARARVRQPGCAFVDMSAVDLGFRDGAFDKAVLINMLHHLDAGVVDRLLAQLTRVVRESVVVLDESPDTANLASRFLQARDQGDYIRPRRELRALLERHYQIEHEEAFHNSLRCVAQVLFTMRRRADAPAPDRST